MSQFGKPRLNRFGRGLYGMAHNSNSLVPAKITLDYLTDPKDLETFIHAVHYIRKVIISTETMRKFAITTEIFNGAHQ